LRLIYFASWREIKILYFRDIKHFPMNQPGTSEVNEQVKKQMNHLKIYTKQDILSLTKIRRFETKLGERLQVVNDTSDLANSLATSTATYVLFGVPEDLGAKGNHGIGGTDTIWIPFLQSFLNIQSNDFLTGEKCCCLGILILEIFNT
jgi:formiminoglutamase